MDVKAITIFFKKVLMRMQPVPTTSELGTGSVLSLSIYLVLVHNCVSAHTSQVPLTHSGLINIGIL